VSQGLQRQLTLAVRLRDEATFDNFLPSAANHVLLDTLREQTGSGGEPLVLLHGPAGSGKSHLLQASCHQAGARALYLPLAEVMDYAPGDVLQGVETLDLVCLDDLQAVLGRRAWELALFDFYNRARQARCHMVIAADASPRELDVDLDDLRSRLSWGLVFQLAQADDREKADILCFRARRRGLALTADVANYIIHRAPRRMEDLLALLDTLDENSLAEQRSLSIPFVKSVLGW
jgi:DnaA family protein